METLSLQAETRTSTGKTGSRIARAQGQVPAILYGRKGETVHFTVNSRELRKALRTEKKRNVVFALEGLKGEKLAMIQALQVHPVSDDILHVDFLRIDEKEPVIVGIPMKIVGEAPGIVQQGGSVDQPKHSIEVSVLPANIPLSLDVSIEGLFVGQSISAGGVPLPEGCTLVTRSDVAVAAVQATRATRLMDEDETGDAATDTEAETENEDSKES